MRNELTKEQLAQEVTVALPLGALLQLSDRQPSSAALTRSQKLTAKGCAIGERGLYGIYAGNARGYDGELDAVIEVLDEAQERMSWADAINWAEASGGRLPTRKEQALLFANVPELFKAEAYWSCEQYADGPGWAWFQGFTSGTQYFEHEDNKLRARAVRRLPVE